MHREKRVFTIAVTRNPEILSKADLVVNLRDGRIATAKDRVAREIKEIIIT
jgi:hypothetical protein